MKTWLAIYNFYTVRGVGFHALLLTSIVELALDGSTDAEANFATENFISSWVSCDIVGEEAENDGESGEGVEGVHVYWRIGEVEDRWLEGWRKIGVRYAVVLERLKWWNDDEEWEWKQNFLLIYISSKVQSIKAWLWKRSPMTENCWWFETKWSLIGVIEFPEWGLVKMRLIPSCG